MWKIPTFADARAAPTAPPEGVPMGMRMAGRGAAPGGQADEVPDEPPAPELPPEQDGRVQCGCGRWVRPDVLRDLRAVPAAERAKIARGTHPWACDGCWEMAHRTGRVDRTEILAAMGAPEAVQRAVRGRLEALRMLPEVPQAELPRHLEDGS